MGEAGQESVRRPARPSRSPNLSARVSSGLMSHSVFLARRQVASIHRESEKGFIPGNPASGLSYSRKPGFRYEFFSETRCRRKQLIREMGLPNRRIATPVELTTRLRGH